MLSDLVLLTAIGLGTASTALLDEPMTPESSSRRLDPRPNPRHLIA